MTPRRKSSESSDNRPDPRELFTGQPSYSPQSDPASPSPMSEFNEPSCNLILELLPEAIAGDLDNESELIVSRHVSQCHRCGREWKAFFEAHEALGTIKGTDAEPDASFFEGLRADILGQIQHQAQEVSDARALESARRRGLLPFEPAARRRHLSVAAFAATLLFGMFLGTFLGPSGETARPTRGSEVAGGKREAGRVHRVGIGSENPVPKMLGATAEDSDDLIRYIKEVESVAVPERPRERSQDF